MGEMFLIGHGMLLSVWFGGLSYFVFDLVGFIWFGFFELAVHISNLFWFLGLNFSELCLNGIGTTSGPM